MTNSEKQLSEKAPHGLELGIGLFGLALMQWGDSMELAVSSNLIMLGLVLTMTAAMVLIADSMFGDTAEFLFGDTDE